MATGPVFIGVDLGTTNLKAGAFAAADGKRLGSASIRLNTRVAPDGTREQSVATLRGGLNAVFASLRSELGEARWACIEGIGLGSQGGSGALVVRHTGEPLTPLYLWNDSRAAACLPEVTAQRSEEYWASLSQRHGPGMGLARMLWLQQKSPAVLRDDVMYVGAGEVASFMLTGQWFQDACNALQMGCYNVLRDCLDADPLSVVGVGLEKVAPLRVGHQTLPLCAAGAELLGVREGVPVAGPYMDHEAGYLSAAGIFDHPLQCSLGTAWVGNFIVPEPRAGHSPVQLVISAPPPNEGSLVIQPLLTGNVAWDWGLSCFAAGSADPLERAARIFEKRLQAPEAMVCIPWLTQANPLLPGYRGGGTFAGVSDHVEPEDFLRALAAGLCFEFYRVFCDLKNRGAIDGIVLGGGASKGPFFRTLLASLFHPLPTVSVMDEDLAGTRGALAPFSAAVCRSEDKPVPLPPEAEMDAIRAQYQSYLASFDAIYAQHPAAGPYRLA